MSMDNRLLSDRFPRAFGYHPEWCSPGAEAPQTLCGLPSGSPRRSTSDPACGCSTSAADGRCPRSFLRREFGAQVWAADLWFSPSENLQRIRDAGVEDGVFPIHAEARALPFAADFFDAIVSIDSYLYYGTDDMYLNCLARLVKPGGAVGIAQVSQESVKHFLVEKMSAPVHSSPLVSTPVTFARAIEQSSQKPVLQSCDEGEQCLELDQKVAVRPSSSFRFSH